MTTTYTADELAARTMNEDASIRHGASSAGLSARVMTAAGRVGVIVRLEHVDGALMLGLAWLPEGRNSRTAASQTYRAVAAGELDQVDVRPAGLIALDASLDPRAARCTQTNPYHSFGCTALPEL